MRPADILYSKNLKRTGCRKGIIEIIMAADMALSEKEIKSQLTGNYDRTTFYRSFKTLVEHNIVHKIVIDNQIVKFALDNAIASKNEHAHFYCNECHSVQCIESELKQEIKLPDGYIEEEMEILVKGTCAFCRK